MRVGTVVAWLLIATPLYAGELGAWLPAGHGSVACWSRAYDAAHLASHPEQKVSQVALGLTFSAADADNRDRQQFALSASLWDGSHGTAIGECRAGDGAMICGVECDGGGIVVTSRGESVLVDLEQSGFIRLASECGADEGFVLEAGADDRQFLLHQLPADQCTGILGELAKLQ